MKLSQLRKIVREELEKYDGGFTDEWNDQRKKNAEVLGYKLSGKSDIKEGATERKGKDIEFDVVESVNEGKKVVKAKTVKGTRHQNQRQVAQELIKKLKRKGWKVPQYLSDASTLEKQIINAYEKARKKWDSTMGDTVILSVSDNKDFTDKNFKWVKESVNEAKEIKFHQIQPKDYIWYRGGIQYFVTKTGPNVLHMGLVNKGKPGSGGSLFASNTKLTRKNFDSQIRVKFIKKITRDKNTLWQESVNEGKRIQIRTPFTDRKKVEKVLRNFNSKDYEYKIDMSNKYVKTIDIEKNLKDKLVSALEKKNISIKIKESVNEGADYSKVPTKKLVKTYKQMADERLSSSAALTFRLIAKELIKRKAKLEGTCGYAPEGKVDVHNTDKLTPAGPHLLKKQKKKVESMNEKVIKVSKKDNIPGNPMKMKGEEKIKKLVYSGSIKNKGSYEIKGNKLNVNNIRPRDKGFFVRHFTMGTGFRKANLYYDGVHWQGKKEF